MTNQDRQYKIRTKERRKEILCDIQWAIEANYRPIAHCQLGFIFEPLANSVPIIKIKDLPSMFLTFYIHTFN